MYLSKEELTQKAEKFQAYLEKKIGSEPADLMERTEMLSILIAQSGQCLANAKYLQDQIINGTIMEALKNAYEDRLSASILNQYVKSNAKDYNYLVNWLDRINSTATHQLDATRTLISYKKAEMNL